MTYGAVGSGNTLQRIIAKEGFPGRKAGGKVVK